MPIDLIKEAREEIEEEAKSGRRALGAMADVTDWVGDIVRDKGEAVLTAEQFAEYVTLGATVGEVYETSKLLYEEYKIYKDIVEPPIPKDEAVYKPPIEGSTAEVLMESGYNFYLGIIAVGIAVIFFS